MRNKLVFCFVLLTFIGVCFAYEVEPFEPGESKSVEIYEAALPLLEKCEELFTEEDYEPIFEDIQIMAAEIDFDMETLREEILSDPAMSYFTVTRLRAYADHNLTRSKSESYVEHSEELMDAAMQAHYHEMILELLIAKWSPEAIPTKEAK